MSGNIDFKALWQQQPDAAKPDINTVISKAIGLKRKTRNKLIWTNLTLVITGIITIIVGVNLDTRVLTTTVGIIMIIFSIVFFIVVNNGLYLNLFKSHPEADTFTYLAELVAIQKKQRFIQTKVLNLYFLFLGAGLLLYMIEFVKKMGVLWGSVAYICPFSGLVFVYFYITPKEFRRQQAEMNAAIEKVQAINDQLVTTKGME
jgi:hypothetical protein